MSGAAIITVLSGLVLLLAVLRAAQVLRQERESGSGARRGTEPGSGDSIIESHYSSGVSGGQSMTYRISRDPQTYAKLFIPKDRKK
ncbi:hypothetical protein C6W92_10060 [Roseovarius sp. A46]|uniref:hypothetical protein n=1 Tax=Roseovarius sp. A46 TaxID=2109331 RepID=UPI001011C867|nr:hypothetical protein [Roseovarius sp. A46]RXV63230.1 hypothetical protein C6W92_10060 [Roseovarius sp. A46]